METLADGVWRSILIARPDALLIAHGGSNRTLPLWLARMWLRLLWLILTGRVEFVLAGDAPVYAAIRPLTRLGQVPASAMVLGLDVAYPNVLYRWLVVRPLRRCRHVIAISRATRGMAVSAGVPENRVSVLRLGVPLPTTDVLDRDRARLELHRWVSLPDDAVPIVTLGRLVRRKGVAWFVAEVLPRLPEAVHYVIAGSGPEDEAIREAARGAFVADRVHLLGRVSEEVREMLMAGCAAFVQPNVEVPGDMEGFGLVTVEAALRGAPVVAADLEGIKDAVVSEETGLLVPSGDADSWVRTLRGLLSRPQHELDELGARYGGRAAELFSERSMGDRLLAMLSVARDGATGVRDA